MTALAYPLVETSPLQPVWRFESNLDMDTLFENNPHPMWIYDLETLAFLAVNDAAVHHYGYSRAEFLGMTIADIRPEEDVPALLRNVARAPQGFDAAGHWRHRRQDGSIILVEITSHTLTFAGRPAKLVSAHDITARRQAEEHLRYQALLIENVSDAIVSTDADFNIRSWNKAAERMFGYTAAEILGRPALEPLAAEYVSGTREAALQQLYETGRWEGEVRLRHKAGHIVYALAASSVVRDEAGNITGLLAINHDITGRKQAEASLRLQSAALEATVNGIVITDRDGNIQWANTAYSQLTGYSLEEVKGKNPRLLSSGLQDKAFYKTMWNTILSGKAWHGELVNKRKDGSLYHDEMTITPLVGADGEITHFIGVKQNITERKQTEQTLRASEDRYRDLVENIHDLIGTHDMEGNILSINAAAARLLGVENKVLVNLNLRDILVPAARGKFDDYLAAIQRDGQAKGLMHVQTADGEQRIWVYDNTVRADTGGAPIVRALARDVTEQKEAEMALRESEAHYRDIFDGVQEAIFVESLDGKILAVNERACEIYGYPREEFLTKTVADLVPPDLPILWADGSGRQLSSTLLETFNRRANGEVFPIEISGRYQTLNGERALLVVARDITERKRAEAQLQRHVAELEAVARISSALRAAPTLEEMLPILMDETLAVLGTDTGSVVLYDAAHGNLRPYLGRGWFAALDQSPMQTEEGIAGRVFTTGEALRSFEFATDPRAREVNRARIVPGWGGVCLPIRALHAVVGVMFIAVPLPRVLRDDEIRLLTTLAEIAGNAIHRTRLHEQTEAHLRQVQALRAIDAAITSSFDLRLTFDIVLSQALAQLGVDAAAVLLLSPHTRWLDYAAGRGFRTRAIENARLPLGESFAGRAALERETVRADSAQISASEQFSKFWLGESFVAYHGVPLIAKGEVKGVLEIFHRAPLHPAPEWLDFLDALAGQAAIAIDNAGLFEGLQRSNVDLALAYDATIEGWSRALDLRDKETEGHSQRVTEMTLRLAQAMGFSDAELIHLRRGALLHDIGKMGVPDGILLKPGPLTEAEWDIMRQHPQYAYDMLAPIAYLRPALDIPYSHHEKWDGTGYPRGLKGEAIPLAARLFAVVDVWDALRSDRLYRAAWPDEQVREYIRSLAGAHFDPRVVEVFLRVMEQT